MRRAFEFLGPRRPLVVVEVKVNGRGPLPFIVDTGATVTSITPSIAERISMASRSAAGLGSAGAFETKVGVIDTLEYCGIRIRNSPVAIIDLSHLAAGPNRPAGILGYSALQNSRLTINYHEQWIEVEDLKGNAHAASLDPP